MKCHQAFQPCLKSYEQYYLNQAGHGLNYFVGKRHQRGRGFLNEVTRSIVPLLKSGAKHIARQGLKTAGQVAKDVLLGQNINTSMKRRSKEAGKRLFEQAVSHMTGDSINDPPSAKRIKTRGSRPRKQSRRRHSKRRIRDIFS